MRVLFVGINPGVRSAQTGHHFAGFSNRFWKLLYESRLVPEPISFEDDDRLPEWGYGITNIVARPTPGIDTLRPEEYVAGRARLRRKVLPLPAGDRGDRRRDGVPRACFPNAAARCRSACSPSGLATSAVFVLPNPSGRNANFSYAEMLAAFRLLARHLRRHS